MTHSHLLKVLAYLGLRRSAKIAGSRCIPIFPSLVLAFPQSRTRLVDNCCTLWQPRYHTTRIMGNFCYPLLYLAGRGACWQMGQASSVATGNGRVDENGQDRSKEGIDMGLKGIEVYGGSINEIGYTKISNYVNGNVEGEVEQKPAVEVLAKADEVDRTLEAVVPPEDALASELDEKLEKDMVSKGKEASTLEDAENVKKAVVIEDTAKASKVLDLAFEELGEPPERPLPGDCCGGGCDPCVWDTYNDELRDYLARKKALLEKSK